MSEIVKNLCFTGLRYRATVMIGRKEVSVTHDPVKGESIEDVKSEMVASAKNMILNEVCK